MRTNYLIRDADGSPRRVILLPDEGLIDGQLQPGETAEVVPLSYAVRAEDSGETVPPYPVTTPQEEP